MYGSTLLALVWVLSACYLLVQSQRYQITDFTTVNNGILTDSYGFSLSDEEIIFELKTCSGSAYCDVLSSTGWIFFIVIWKSPTGKKFVDFQIQGGTRHSVEESSLNFCSGEYKKFRFSWRKNTYSLWLYQSTGWKVIFTQASANTGQINNIRLRSVNNVDWKLYNKVHTTDPFSVTCRKI